jgi:NFU1 iron-sulfur cluster scaffold homolog, mitochondrial
MENQIPPVQVYAESTPNPSTMKFVVNRPLLIDNSVEYSDVSQTKSSPLATALFQFPFIKSVYIKNNFVTVTKVPVIEWMEIQHELREFIINFFKEGKVAVTELPPPAEKKEKKSVVHETPLNPTEIESKIIDILDEYIKPAVEQDGGEISFKSFDEGIVSVVLRGSCSGCPSSTLTLKAGIEQLLKRMVPGVESVVAENE